MRSSIIFLTIFISFAAIILSCTSAKKISKSSLNQRWDLLTVDSVSTEKVLVSKGYIEFLGKQKGGAKAGCNQMFFTYEVLKDNKIKFSQVGSTMMHCPEMETENALGKLIPLVNHFDIADSKLYLRIDDKIVITAN